ncbi:LytR/AlgR family response regulator transcription factor [Wocania ichthyoenteri]|uniref:LytR/AlgR family response regulator transcription factor n=1 Tax=Wocania ichthyoenteri TaxID=1230531 RepID=UPI00053DD5CF|nr:response regulator [Wocania ichthyoenteri]
MDKIKILVVEDEIIIADNICSTLKNIGYTVLEPAINYSEAIQIIETQKPDLAILDIQLSGKKTGLELAKKIKEEYNFPFIFLTSNADVVTINEAKKLAPPAYLIKPFTKDELYASIEIVIHNYTENKDKANNEALIIKDSIFVKEKGALVKVILEDILYIKSSHIYIEIFLKSKQKYIVRFSLNEIIDKLPSSFIRIHRGFIINSMYLIQINNSSLKVGDEILPIGKTYKLNILNKISSI